MSKVPAKLLQSCPALHDPVDCSLPVSSVQGILQAGIQEWVGMSSSRGSSWPRDRNCVSCGSCIAGGFFTTKSLGKPEPVQATNQNSKCDGASALISTYKTAGKIVLLFCARGSPTHPWAEKETLSWHLPFLVPWSWTSQPPELGEINVCCS